VAASERESQSSYGRWRSLPRAHQRFAMPVTKCAGSGWTSLVEAVVLPRAAHSSP
jgi:hypothetical protein